MRRKQQLFLLDEFKGRDEHGGELGRGRRKLARPIATRRSMHLVLRATAAVGRLSFLRPEHAQFIESELGRLGRRYGVRVREFANVGNHLHLNAVRLVAA